MSPLQKLGLTALLGLPCCIGAFHLFRTKVSEKIKSTKIHEEAIGALKGHRGAVFLLGQPIEDFYAQFNSMGVKEQKRMDVKIPVLGPKSRGVLFYSTVADEKGEIQLDTVQLQVGKDNTKRLVIKKSRNEISSNSSNNETTNGSSNDETTNSSSSDETKSSSPEVEDNKTPNYKSTNSSPDVESGDSENS